jgi:hypothetical protein
MGQLAPSVEKPRARLRLGFVVALLLVMAAGVVTLLVRQREPAAIEPRDWWTEVGPHCTPLEVEVTLRNHTLATGQQATCLAVAGKIDRARELLLRAPDGVAMLFAIAHPIADAGDDRSAGPIMKLVVEFSPDNYMAVFHAGMADYALGNDGDARAMLLRFLDMYTVTDVWRERAQGALAGIDAHVPLPEREAHFAE